MPITRPVRKTMVKFEATISLTHRCFVNEFRVDPVEVYYWYVIGSRHMPGFRPARSGVEAESLVKTIYCGRGVTYFETHADVRIWQPKL